mgnify:CR=1 FL=1
MSKSVAGMILMAVVTGVVVFIAIYAGQSLR